MERLPGLQARLQAYQEKTKNLELVWRLPIPVPTAQRSRMHDYYFSYGRFEVEGGEPAMLAVFAKNFRKEPDLRDPAGFMLIKSPYGTIEDLLVIFHTHIGEADMGTVVNSIRVIKGVRPQIPGTMKEAEHFNVLVNKEIAKLLLLGTMAAQGNMILRAHMEFERIENIVLH